MRGVDHPNSIFICGRSMGQPDSRRDCDKALPSCTIYPYMSAELHVDPVAICLTCAGRATISDFAFTFASDQQEPSAGNSLRELRQPPWLTTNPFRWVFPFVRR
jgi:hypothetical protein